MYSYFHPQPSGIFSGKSESDEGSFPRGGGAEKRLRYRNRFSQTHLLPHVCGIIRRLQNRKMSGLFYPHGGPKLVWHDELDLYVVTRASTPTQNIYRER